MCVCVCGGGGGGGEEEEGNLSTKITCKCASNEIIKKTKL